MNKLATKGRVKIAVSFGSRAQEHAGSGGMSQTLPAPQPAQMTGAQANAIAANLPSGSALDRSLAIQQANSGGMPTIQQPAINRNLMGTAPSASSAMANNAMQRMQGNMGNAVQESLASRPPVQVASAPNPSAMSMARSGDVEGLIGAGIRGAVPVALNAANFIANAPANYAANQQASAVAAKRNSTPGNPLARAFGRVAKTVANAPTPSTPVARAATPVRPGIVGTRPPLRS